MSNAVAAFQKPVLTGMIDDNVNLLACWATRNLPARVNVEIAAKLLGFSVDDLTILTGADHLLPLGKPAPNAPKYFSAIEMVGLAADREWLDKATRMISQYWRKKRQRKNNSNNNPTIKTSKSDQLQIKTPSTDSSTNPSIIGQLPSNGAPLTSNEQICTKGA